MNIRKVSLSLSGIQLTEFPKEVFETKRLAKLDLSGNNIQSIPIEVGNLEILEELNINGNFVNDLPLEGPTFPRLKRLWMAHNPLTSLQSELLIKNLKKLMAVYCFNSRISNPLVSKDRGLLLG